MSVGSGSAMEALGRCVRYPKHLRPAPRPADLVSPPAVVRQSGGGVARVLRNPSMARPLRPLVAHGTCQWVDRRCGVLHINRATYTRVTALSESDGALDIT